MNLRWFAGLTLCIPPWGCGLDTSGLGGPASGVADQSTEAGDAETAAAATGDGSTTATLDGTTTSDTATDPAMSDDGVTTEEVGDAALVIIGGPVFDFANVELSTNAVRLIEVRNEGDAAASAIVATAEGDCFGFVGSTYPGHDGTCGDSLEPGVTCTVVVECGAKAWGNAEGLLRIDYVDPVEGPARATADLVAHVFGTSENRVANGGGEQFGMPPPMWEQVTGSSWRTTDELASSGAASIFAGYGPEIETFQARQWIDLTSWGSSIDNEGITMRLSADVRTRWEDDDPGMLRLRLLDAKGDELVSLESPRQSTTRWQTLTIEVVAPVGTREAEVVLRCEHQTGENCNAYFDEVTFVGSY